MTTPQAPRVLLVDDEANMRRSLRYLLEVEDITVVGECGDGVEAVALAQEVRPDVVLMDLRMPGLNGLEATRQIKGVLPGTQVVIFTAYDDSGLGRQAEQAGAYRCLVKGCSGDELVDLVFQAYKAGDRPSGD
ncbi:MAG TPA: response regulator transcription factor [Actinomycetota bacterium]|nr:response regulator transcription factor [Actinomycetota bacterium]